MFAFWRTLTRRRVVVNLRDGDAFVGILYAKRGPLLVLRDTVMHRAGMAEVPVDGEVVVERSRVAYIQVLPA